MAGTNNNEVYQDKTSSRYYSLGDIIIEVKADLPITEATFHPKFSKFQVFSPGSDKILIHQHFSLPKIEKEELGVQLHQQAPWAIFYKNHTWTYLRIPPDENDPNLCQVAFFNEDHTFGDIYTENDEVFVRGCLDSLSLFPTDQIFLSRVLAKRQGCILHSSGMVINDQGFAFVGHSGAGKSTIVNLLRHAGEILCDDRNIIRRWQNGWRIYGTWSHGDIPDVSPASAPLRAILILEQSLDNRLIPVTDHREIVRRLPFLIVRPLITADWWEKTLDLIGAIAREVPVYRLQFDRSGQVIDVLRALL